METRKNPTNLTPSGNMIRLEGKAFITVIFNGESFTIRKSDSEENFEKALSYFRDKEWDKLYAAMNPIRAAVSNMEYGDITVNSMGVSYKGRPINNTVTERIVSFAKHDLPIEPIARFLDKLMKNPSKRAVEELYTFLEHKNLPITENGNFLAYKAVDANFYSITKSKYKGEEVLLQGTVDDSGAIYNGVGEVVEKNRNDVDDNKEVGCSEGLHAGTIEYAAGFKSHNGRIVIVEINPSDVVSIPVDCNFQKLRTCKYKVIEEYIATLEKPLYESKWQVDEIDFSNPCPFEPVHDSDCDCEECDCEEWGCESSTIEGCKCNDNEVFEPDVDDFYGSLGVPDIEFEVNNSDWIDYVEYYTFAQGYGSIDDIDDLLVIRLDSGDFMMYQNVDVDVVKEFEEICNNPSESPGSFYHSRIKPVYTLLTF